MKTAVLLLAALVLSASIFSGCIGKTEEKKAPETTQSPVDDISPDEIQDLTDADVPLIPENDTVEIGEMI